MRTYDELRIRVHSRWNGWHHAEVRFADLQDVHWLQEPGAPCELVHGYISCSHIVTGDIPHRCEPASAPHRLHICILKRHTIPAVYAELAGRADERRHALDNCVVAGIRHRSVPAGARRL